MMGESEQQFAVLEFLTNGTDRQIYVDIAPLKWLLEDRKQVYWPPKLHANLRRKHAAPDTDTWSIHDVKCLDVVDSWEVAVRKRKWYELHSSSECEEHKETRHKRRKKQTAVFSTDSDSDVETNTKLLQVAPITPNIAEYKLQKNLTERSNPLLPSDNITNCSSSQQQKVGEVTSSFQAVDDADHFTNEQKLSMTNTISINSLPGNNYSNIKGTSCQERLIKKDKNSSTPVRSAGIRTYSFPRKTPPHKCIQSSLHSVHPSKSKAKNQPKLSKTTHCSKRSFIPVDYDAGIHGSSLSCNTPYSAKSSWHSDNPSNSGNQSKLSKSKKYSKRVDYDAGIHTSIRRSSIPRKTTNSNKPFWPVGNYSNIHIAPQLQEFTKTTSSTNSSCPFNNVNIPEVSHLQKSSNTASFTDSFCSIENDADVALKRMLITFHTELRRDIKDIKAELRSIKSLLAVKTKSSKTVSELEKMFPLSNLEEIDKVDKLLEDHENFITMVRCLSDVGGTNDSQLKECTYQVMGRVLRNTLACKFNFCGSRGPKSGFKHLKLCSAVTRTVSKVHPEASRKSIHNCIQSWLKYAPQRKEDYIDIDSPTRNDSGKETNHDENEKNPHSPIGEESHEESNEEIPFLPTDEEGNPVKFLSEGIPLSATSEEDHDMFRDFHCLPIYEGKDRVEFQDINN